MNLALGGEEEMPNMVEFSDEEGYGRFLDLHEHYQRYVNVKGFDKCDYLDYLGHFDKLFEIEKTKKNSQYKDYITHVSSFKHWLEISCRCFLKIFQFTAYAQQ